MKRFVSALLLAAWLSCGCGGDQGATPAATPKGELWGTAPRLYTDHEAETFRSRLDALSYPTTPEMACETLGIVMGRLAHPRGMINGRAGQRWTRLSETYYISFQFQVDGSVGGSISAHYDKVLIYQSKK